MQNPVTLLYYDSGGTQHTQTFDALRVKGVDPSDNLEQFPGVIFKAVDGSYVQPTIGTRRHFNIDLGVLQAYTDRLFCANYMVANRKVLTYTHDGINEIALSVVNEDALRPLKTEWLDNVEIARFVTLAVQESQIQFQFTPSNPVIVDTDMYLKVKVAITGTDASPEHFVTNSGKLATCDAPSGSYPAFNAATQKFSIGFDERQDCSIHQVGEIAVVSGNLDFYLAASDYAGSDASGTIYSDIKIYIVNI